MYIVHCTPYGDADFYIHLIYFGNLWTSHIYSIFKTVSNFKQLFITIIIMIVQCLIAMVWNLKLFCGIFATIPHFIFNYYCCRWNEMIFQKSARHHLDKSLLFLPLAGYDSIYGWFWKFKSISCVKFHISRGISQRKLNVTIVHTVFICFCILNP